MEKNYQSVNMETIDIKERNAYLVGSGIASLAVATYLIRDAHMPGENIYILEELNVPGGSLDGSGSPKDGYVIRGGRMFNHETYECTWDLLRFIPSLQDPTKSVRDEIMEFNAKVKTHAKARLIDKNRQIVEVCSMGFSNKDRLDLIQLMTTPEDVIQDTTIDQWFSLSFFETPFWYMWATMFAFQPWHSAIEFKRYINRFIHEFPRIHTLEGVIRTPYNQYDSVILPIVKWLNTQGVNFQMSCRVLDLDCKSLKNQKTVESIHCMYCGNKKRINIRDCDLVFVTNGSMTEGYSLGSMKAAPILGTKGSSFSLWENIARKQPDLGNPSVFADHIKKSLWESFTITCKTPKFFSLMEKFSGNKPGTGALVTFKDSNWLMSIVLAYQPHFINQPSNIKVFWGYSLFPNNIGNYVPKKMSECTGEEILIELCSHLEFTKDIPSILETSNCIPCMMPLITSQFMPRTKGARPEVVPKGSTNLAFIGQFVEIPDDVVFTVEYSVRSAQIAVYSLLKLNKEVSRLNQFQYDVRVLFNSFIASFR